MTQRAGIHVQAPERFIAVTADSFSNHEGSVSAIKDFLAVKVVCESVRAVKIPGRMYAPSHNDNLEFVRDAVLACDLETIADLQLSGPITDMTERFAWVAKRFMVNMVTVSSGVPHNTLIRLSEIADTLPNKPRLLLTGVLPEDAPFRQSEESFYAMSIQDTLIKSRVAGYEEIGAAGIYGAAVYAQALPQPRGWAQAGLEYIGSGISLEGSEYKDMYGVRKVGVTPAQALGYGCTMLMIGTEIGQAEDRVAVFEAINENIDSWRSQANIT